MFGRARRRGLKGVCPKDEIVKLLLFPSSRGGVDATSKNIAEGILRTGADGVVRNVFDHPVCASKVASQHFLDAQPPLLWRRGIAASPPFHQVPATRSLLRVLFTITSLRQGGCAPNRRAGS